MFSFQALGRLQFPILNLSLCPMSRGGLRRLRMSLCRDLSTPERFGGRSETTFGRITLPKTIYFLHTFTHYEKQSSRLWTAMPNVFKTCTLTIFAKPSCAPKVVEWWGIQCSATVHVKHFNPVIQTFLFPYAFNGFIWKIDVRCEIEKSKEIHCRARMAKHMV